MSEVALDRRAAVKARLSFLQDARRFTPLVAVEAERARYLVSTADYGVSLSLFVRSARGEMRLLARALQILSALGLDDGITSGTFVDVGANIGTTTVTAMCSHGFARAVACEPEPNNQRLLELNFVANRLERDVEICRAAVADRDGTVELLVSKFRSGSHEVNFSGREVPEDSKSRSVIEVRQVALDSLAADGTFDPEEVTFLWMDAQGHEGHVLRGASSLTDRGVPVVLELFPGMMDRHGGLDYFKETALACYTHYVPVHRARGKVEARFDLFPIDTLTEEIRRLLAGAKVTDVLLVRDPPSRPQRGGGPGRPVEARHGTPREYAERTKANDPSATSPPERETFLRKASTMTSLVGAEIEDNVFLIRTSADASERQLFVERSHPRLALLSAALWALDELGLGARAREGTLVEIGAGVGISTVAGLAWHGFRRVLACEHDPSSFDVLKLNLAANGLSNRVRALPVALADQELDLDDLLERGLIAAGEPGLVWIETGDVEAIVDGGSRLLAGGPPLLLKAISSAIPTLPEGYTHLVHLDENGHVLAVRRPEGASSSNSSLVPYNPSPRRRGP